MKLRLQLAGILPATAKGMFPANAEAGSADLLDKGGFGTFMQAMLPSAKTSPVGKVAASTDRQSRIATRPETSGPEKISKGPAAEGGKLLVAPTESQRGTPFPVVSLDQSTSRSELPDSQGTQCTKELPMSDETPVEQSVRASIPEKPVAQISIVRHQSQLLPEHSEPLQQAAPGTVSPSSTQSQDLSRMRHEAEEIEDSERRPATTDP